MKCDVNSMAFDNAAYSIWGGIWTKFRKWFYPLWLGYELNRNFIGYSSHAGRFISNYSTYLELVLDPWIIKVLYFVVPVFIYVNCHFFLTVPACWGLVYFLSHTSISRTKLEEKLKRIL